MSQAPTKPRIAVSACLLGHPTRYDGALKRCDLLLELLGSQVEWLPFCPEVGAGLPTPREPMHVEQAGTDLRLLTNRTGREHTAAVLAYADAELARWPALGVRGCVLKSRSPSCGLRDTPVLSATGPGLGSGLFVVRLAQAMPDLPLCTDEEFLRPELRAVFMQRIGLCSLRSGG